MESEDVADLARERLVDAVLLYRLQPEHQASLVVDEATNALVAGMDTHALRELAGSSKNDSRWTLDPLVERVSEDLDLASDGDEGETQTRAASAMCRRALRGEVSYREVARWAHLVIGHAGAPDVQDLVELDDHYDTVDYGPITLDGVEALARDTVAEVANRL